MRLALGVAAAVVLVAGFVGLLHWTTRDWRDTALMLGIFGAFGSVIGLAALVVWGFQLG